MCTPISSQIMYRSVKLQNFKYVLIVPILSFLCTLDNPLAIIAAAHVIPRIVKNPLQYYYATAANNLRIFATTL